MKLRPQAFARISAAGNTKECYIFLGILLYIASIAQH